jgi:hypothetical protein
MNHKGRNDGFRVLDDFVCEAIHSPDVLLADEQHKGQNAGSRVVEELSFDASGDKPGPQGDQSEPANHPKLYPRYPGYCSFCRKSYHEVGALAEGPDEVFICYRCLLLCKEIIENECARRGVEPLA